jgi:hypothetical protein
MTEPIHYTRARRERYLQELPLAVQVGAIIDELRARGAAQSPAFVDLCARIDAIKAEVPKA